MNEFLGMSLNETLIAIAIILILIDIFFASDIPTHIAYIIFSYTLAKQIEVALLYQIMFGILIWFALVVFHYVIWIKIIKKINDKYIAPRRHIGGIEGLVGQTGVIKEVEGKKFVVVNGELYAYETEGEKDFQPGEEVKIKNVISDKLVIY